MTTVQWNLFIMKNVPGATRNVEMGTWGIVVAAAAAAAMQFDICAPTHPHPTCSVALFLRKMSQCSLQILTIRM